IPTRSRETLGRRGRRQGPSYGRRGHRECPRSGCYDNFQPLSLTKGSILEPAASSTCSAPQRGPYSTTWPTGSARPSMRCGTRSSREDSIEPSYVSPEPLSEVVTDPERVRHDGERRIHRAARREEARVDDVEVVDVMSLAVDVEGRGLGIPA